MSYFFTNPIAKNLLAEMEWRLTAGADFSATSDDNELYDIWAKKRRDHFKKWGNLATTHEENKTLEALKGKYRGERIFILGSGPSLKETALEKLENEFTFGVNKIYLLYDQVKWRPDFYTINDWEVGPDNFADINALKDSVFFCPTRFRGLFEPRDNMVMYNSCHARDIGGDTFSFDMTQGAVMGGTVLTLVIQLAYYMGFDPIHLIGVDVNYVVPESVKQSGKVMKDGHQQFMESTEDDINHFHPDYFGKGRKFHNPNPKHMMRGFDDCRAAIEADGGQIYNATVGGKLEHLQRVDFDALFTEDGQPQTNIRKALSRPIASIVMPAYNAGKYIRDAIDSVRAQTYRNWELIIIDDGSTDDTAKVVKSYDDLRIHYHYQENGGRASARNAGLDRAKGKYIAFLDADDLFSPKKLETQFDLLEASPDVTGIMGSWSRISENGETLMTKKAQDGAIVPGDKFFSGCPIHLCMSLMRRDLIDAGVRFEKDRRYAEDWEFFLRLTAKHNAKFMTHSELVGSYRSTPQALTKTTEKFARSHISVVDNSFKTFLKGAEYSDSYRKARCEVTMRLAARFFGTRQAVLGKKFMREAAKYRPVNQDNFRNRTAVHLIHWTRQFDTSQFGWLLKQLDEDFLQEVGMPNLAKTISEKITPKA